jgi:hypothetical protein
LFRKKIHDDIDIFGKSLIAVQVDCNAPYDDVSDTGAL